MNLPVLSLRNFSYPFFDKNSSKIKNFSKPVSLELHKGEVLVVAGVSGIGKTIMMNSILGLEKCNGVVKINDTYAVLHSQDNFDIKQSIEANFLGYYDAFKISYNINEIREQVNSFTQKSLKTLISECSLGTQRRLALLRVLMCPKTRLFFLDEPTTGMDSYLVARVKEKINYQKTHYNCGFWVITHEKNLASCADKLLLISHEKVSLITKKNSCGFVIIQGFKEVNNFKIAKTGELVYQDLNNQIKIFRFFNLTEYQEVVNQLQKARVSLKKFWCPKEETIAELSKHIFYDPNSQVKKKTMV